MIGQRWRCTAARTVLTSNALSRPPTRTPRVTNVHSSDAPAYPACALDGEVRRRRVGCWTIRASVRPQRSLVRPTGRALPGRGLPRGFGPLSVYRGPLRAGLTSWHRVRRRVGLRLTGDATRATRRNKSVIPGTGPDGRPAAPFPDDPNRPPRLASVDKTAARWRNGGLKCGGCRYRDGAAGGRGRRPWRRRSGLPRAGPCWDFAPLSRGSG